MTAPKAAAWHLVPCNGSAHDPARGAPYIDNCMRCAPRWASVVVPASCVSAGEWDAIREQTSALGPMALKALLSSRRRASNRMMREQEQRDADQAADAAEAAYPGRRTGADHHRVDTDTSPEGVELAK